MRRRVSQKTTPTGDDYAVVPFQALTEEALAGVTPGRGTKRRADAPLEDEPDYATPVPLPRCAHKNFDWEWVGAFAEEGETWLDGCHALAQECPANATPFR